MNKRIKTILRICLGSLVLLIGVAWLISPIPGSAVAILSGAYLINEKWANKKFAFIRDKFRKK